jgi:hypothetical protein
MMSDSKPRRGAREAARSEAAIEEVIAAAATPAIEPNIVPEPEPVSTIALAQAAPIGPACTIPAASETLPSVDKPRETAAEHAWTAFVEAQFALARGFEKAAVEVTGFSRSGMAATTDAAVALLGARTFAEALEINAGLTRRGIDAMFEGSARLSEIGAQALADASRPLFARLGRDWSALGGG